MTYTFGSLWKCSVVHLNQGCCTSSNEKTQRVDNRFHLIYLPLSSGWGWRALKPWRERALKRGTRLVWREKLGIERVPLRFAVFPPNRRAISHCSLMTTSPTWRAPAAAAADPIFIWFNILTQRNVENSQSEAKVADLLMWQHDRDRGIFIMSLSFSIYSLFISFEACLKGRILAVLLHKFKVHNLLSFLIDWLRLLIVPNFLV